MNKVARCGGKVRLRHGIFFLEFSILFVRIVAADSIPENSLEKS